MRTTAFAAIGVTSLLFACVPPTDGDDDAWRRAPGEDTGLFGGPPGPPLPADPNDPPPTDPPPGDPPPDDPPPDDPPPDDPPPDDPPPDDPPPDDPPEQCASGPLTLPIDGCAPTPPPSTGDPHQDCVDRINQFRAECQCLPPLQRWTDGEDCADRMAEADHNSGQAHGAAAEGLCAWGSGQNECPGWGGVGDVIDGCLQMMWDEGPGEPFYAHGHYLHMSSMDKTHVACGFFDGQNGTWAVQNFY